MAKTSNISAAAKQFIKEWTGKGYEKGETQRFWLSLLHNVFGVDDPTRLMEFEVPVKTITKEKGADFIDAYIVSTKVLIEQKGSHVDLSAKARQSDGSELTPYQQGRRYATGLPLSMAPRWIVACNFTTFEIHDMEHPNDAPEIVRLEDLEKEYYRLSFLVDDTAIHTKREVEVSMAAGAIIGEIFDAFRKEYRNPDDPHSQRSLNILCVRLVFCLYAEDAGLFDTHSQFHDYLVQFKPGTGDMRKALIELFDVLSTPREERDPYLRDDLLAFPYVNGGLFAEKGIEIPRFTQEIADLLLRHASDDFDWSQISPTIFGGVFESTLNPETRRKGGMHYTSIENIHKVIDPLFLDELKQDLADIKAEPGEKKRITRAREFQDKIAGLKFLDPACGSGNFLTETFISLRRLENECLRIIYKGQMVMGDLVNPIRVSINQFYGIEINDFAVSVAMTALWIAEAQMLFETEKIMQVSLDFLPLKSYNNIREGNALRMDWSEWEVPDEAETIIAEHANVYPYPETAAGVLQEPHFKTVDLYTREVSILPTRKIPVSQHVDFDYIMGNPPFVGYQYQSNEQKADLATICPECGKSIDYVVGWYYKSAQMIQGTRIKAALVSTNSITQGEQVSLVWKPLMENYGVHIDFAYRTFRWDSEASLQAHVHCVIIGFSGSDLAENHRVLRIYDGKEIIEASNISPYLLDAPTVFLNRRSDPLCDVPPFVRGCQPTDDGNFIFTEEERNELLSREPQAEQFIRPFMMGKDFIQREPRYCLWLLGANPSELRKCPLVLQRVENVRAFRMKSTKAATRVKADTPTLFDEIHEPQSDYVAIPKVSSGDRRYIPVDYLSKEVVPGDMLFFMQDSTIYHFGVIDSSLHMCWMKYVCGRLKSDYRFSNTIVYNNFPWPQPTEAQKERISQTAQGILDARALYPNSSLADLYDELAMPPELRRAHRANDAAVMEAYGFRKDMTEPEIVAELFKMYQKLVES